MVRAAAATVVAAVFFAGCERGVVGLPESGEFGTVPVGESRKQAFTLVNEGDEPVQVELSTEGDFSVEPTSLRLAGRGSALVMGTFAPTVVGDREGRLIASFRDRQRALILKGMGTGPRLSTPERVVLPASFIVAGTAPGTLRVAVPLRNLGTAGTSLTLGSPTLEGPAGLCLGTVAGDVCEPWVPPALAAGEEVELPLVYRPSMAGEARWTVSVPSSDPVSPVKRFEVFAITQQVEACDFELPSVLEVPDGTTSTLALRHRGASPCRLESIAVVTQPTNAFSLRLSHRLPAVLAPGALVTVGVTPSPSVFIDGTLRIVALGSEDRTVVLRRVPSAGNCLVVSPASLSFEAARGCVSPTRTFQIYNSCTRTQTVDVPVLLSAAPEFTVSAQFASGAAAVGGSPVPLTFTVRYAPTDVGADAATLRISSREGAQVLVPLEGVGREREVSTMSYRENTRARVDVLLMIDTSPSFLSRRTAVRANLQRHAGYMRAVGCIDWRVALAPAEGGGGTVAFALNDAGSPWSSSREPEFVESVLSAFDALPSGSEVEACVGPAAGLLLDAGVRARSHVFGLCLTDALEQSPQPQAALASLASLASASDGGSLSWNLVTPKAPGCGEEALDDGVHASLLSPTGRWADLCDPDWDFEFERHGCAGGFFDGVFFLTVRPDGPIEVRVDGVLAPSTDWAYSASDNSVRFVPGKWPSGGQTVEITATAACIP